MLIDVRIMLLFGRSVGEAKKILLALSLSLREVRLGPLAADLSLSLMRGYLT